MIQSARVLRPLAGLLCLCLLVPGSAPAQQPDDEEGCKDHPLFNRMPGYLIQRCEEKQFDVHEFRDAKQEAIQVEGRVFLIRYAQREGAKESSRIQILRNYENAVKRIGGKVLLSDWDGNSYMKVARDGKEIWVHAEVGLPSEWNLWIVEQQAMAQDVTADAAALAGDLKSTGHAAVYGIYFDTGKSVVKPESEAALAEIAKLLKAEAALKLLVVGHTDNVGGMDANMKLSQARAEAVAQALVARHGIAAARLRGCGVGPLAPVASNDDEAGRARNRRVELVKQ